jgi:hypothetical protein
MENIVSSTPEAEIKTGESRRKHQLTKKLSKTQQTTYS